MIAMTQGERNSAKSYPAPCIGSVPSPNHAEDWAMNLRFSYAWLKWCDRYGVTTENVGGWFALMKLVGERRAMQIVIEEFEVCICPPGSCCRHRGAP